MDDLEREMQSILDVARQAHDPAPDAAVRVRRALAVALAGAGASAATVPAAAAVAGGGASGAGVGGAAGFGSASSLVSTIKYGAIGLLLGTSGIGVGTAVYSSVGSAAHPASVSEIATTVERTPSRESASQPPVADEFPQPVQEVVEAERQARGKVPAAADDGSPGATAELRAEAQALHLAEKYLENDPERALVQLDAMQRAHPDGVLTEEALAARVFAHCNLGQREQAFRAADRFFREFPRSVHAPRVRASCALNTGSSTRPATAPSSDGSHVSPTMDE